MGGLIADIGGTNARFALVRDDSTPEQVEVLTCREHESLAAACEAYLGRSRPSQAPEAGAIAVASAVTGDDVRMTNHPWSFSIEDLRQRLGLKSLEVVNDFVAVALAIPVLTGSDVEPVGGGKADHHSPVAILGPGTGLGVAGLITVDGKPVPIASEGGHSTMAAVDKREDEVFRILRGRFDHVSAERVVSGPGLQNLYRALNELEGHDPDSSLEPKDIASRAREGSCPFCVEALRMFTELLGTFASNVALTFGARGGVYIAGGIVPRLGETFSRAAFRRRFEEKGRFSDFLKQVPTFIVTHDQPAFPGLARLVSKT